MLAIVRKTARKGLPDGVQEGVQHILPALQHPSCTGVDVCAGQRAPPAPRTPQGIACLLKGLRVLPFDACQRFVPGSPRESAARGQGVSGGCGFVVTQGFQFLESYSYFGLHETSHNLLAPYFGEAL